MRRRQTVRVNGVYFDLVEEPGLDTAIAAYRVMKSGTPIGAVAQHGWHWRYSVAQTSPSSTAADAVERMLQFHAARSMSPNPSQFDAQSPHALLAYSDPVPGQRISGRNTIVVAVLEDEDEAHRMWGELTRLVDARRLAVYSKVTRWQLAAPILSVRPADHLDALSALPGTVVKVLAPGKGTRDRDAALRRWGKDHGYRGSVGGWITRPPDRRPIGQGWRTLDRDEYQNPSMARVLHIDDRYRIVVGNPVTPSQQSTSLIDAALS